MEKVTVIDSPCGAGKTNWLIKYIQEHIDTERFIYMSASEEEIARVVYEVNAGKEWHNKVIHNTNPLRYTNWNKRYVNFKTLVENGKSIATSYETISMCSKETTELIASGNYTLILDEVSSVVENIAKEIKFKRDDLALMEEVKLAHIEDDGLFVVDDQEFYGIYSDIMSRSKSGTVHYIDKDTIRWTFPVHEFSAFNRVIISTYMFDNQLQKYYYDLCNIKYDKVSLVDSKIVPYIYEKVNTTKLHIYNKDDLNSIGDDKKSLTTKWYKRTTAKNLKPLKDAMYKFIKNVAKVNCDDVVWTTVKRNTNPLQKRGYDKCFIPSNTRSIQEFKTKHCVIYTVNEAINPFVLSYFKDRGINIDEDKWALAEMIQFISRSAVSNNEDVNVYVPSKRMRELLLDYCKEE